MAFKNPYHKNTYESIRCHAAYEKCKEDLYVLLEEKKREVNQDTGDYGISCAEWKEQAEKHPLRFDQKELMEAVCLDFHKAIGKLELLAEFLNENEEVRI